MVLIKQKKNYKMRLNKEIKMSDILIKLLIVEKKFIRQCSKRYSFQQTYSVTFKKWKRDKKKRKIMLRLKRTKLWPAQINQVANIMWVLENHYECSNKNIVEYAVKLWYEYDDRIYDRIMEKYTKKGKLMIMSPKDALREQKARGFIKINDFENYLKKWDHIQSTVNRDYYYPMNFPGTGEQIILCRNKKREIPTGYCALSAIGVKGHTSVSKGTFKPR